MTQPDMTLSAKLASRRRRASAPSPSAHSADVHRLLSILTLVQSGQRWTPARLSAHFRVTPRTIHRDLRKLDAAGLGLIFDRRRAAYRLKNGVYLAPIQLTPDEALALLVLCEDVAGRGQIALLAPAYRALHKVEAVLPASVRDEALRLSERMRLQTAAPAVPEDARAEAEVYALIQQAIRRGCAIHCRYASARRREAGDAFLFQPYALYFGQRAWYALGRHCGHNEVRWLKLRRFVTPRLSDTRYEIPHGFCLDDAIGNAWQMIRGERDHDVEVLIDPQFAETVTDTRWHHTQRVQRHADGSATMRFTVSGLDEIVWWILAMGPHCRVSKPAELASRVRRLAAETASLYTREPIDSRRGDRASNARKPGAGRDRGRTPARTGASALLREPGRS
jgi:predicted DNA-binding transcriptional regulator YafY